MPAYGSTGISPLFEDAEAIKAAREAAVAGLLAVSAGAFDGEILPPCRSGRVRVDADGVTTRTEWPALSWQRAAPPPAANRLTSVTITYVREMLPVAFVEHDIEGPVLTIGKLGDVKSEKRFAAGVVAEIRCGAAVYAALKARVGGLAI